MVYAGGVHKVTLVDSDEAGGKLPLHLVQFGIKRVFPMFRHKYAEPSVGVKIPDVAEKETPGAVRVL